MPKKFKSPNRRKNGGKRGKTEKTGETSLVEQGGQGVWAVVLWLVVLGLGQGLLLLQGVRLPWRGDMVKRRELLTGGQQNSSLPIQH